MAEKVEVTKTQLEKIFEEWLNECSKEGYDVSIYPGDWPKSSADYVWDKLTKKD